MVTKETGEGMSKCGLGFDTGGTYTDAVIIDLENGNVLCSAKSLTTRDDLSIGIENAISGFDKEILNDVKIVSLSSTLATNSIVEGKGCRVALIAIGREFDKTFPVDEYMYIDGGHYLNGKEKRPLDEKKAIDFLESVRGKVEGVAITSYLSVRNPEHENRISQITHSILDVPVVCGHQLSSNLGFNERTTTCVMNAKLIPIIKDLIVSVKNVMKKYGIVSPLMIVKGDGSIMSEKVALQRPIETVLSGPAASMIGAKTLTGIQDAIVMDMGGTTTDIGILRDGTPRLEKEGAVIDGRRTRVMAAEIGTSGIGGDSRILVNGNEIKLSAQRVVPLCIAAYKWPQLRGKLKEISNKPPRFVPGCLDEKKIFQDIEFFTKLKKNDSISLTDEDEMFLSCLEKGPKTLEEVGNEIRTHPYSLNIPKMEEYGIIQKIGLTPTDLLHAEGTYVEYDSNASKYGVMHQAKKMNIGEKEFIDKAKQCVVNKIAFELLLKLFYEETKETDPGIVGRSLMEKAIGMKTGPDFGCRIILNKPIIGIGAPVGAFFPQVAKIFETELVLPKHSSVGNAVGAITGNIVETLIVVITPLKGEGGTKDPRCTLFSSFGTKNFNKYSEAMEYAKKEGSEVVSRRVKTAGADYFEIKFEQKDKKISLGNDHDGSILLETNLIIAAIGKPREFKVNEKVTYYSDLAQSWDV